MKSSPKLIYSSSPDRGLDTLLYLWPFIHNEFPEAELNIFYGFDWWTKSIEQSGNKQQKQWRDQILEALDQPGVNNHGRVSRSELAEWWEITDVWLYPTRFWETYCITALEAQLSRTAIVTSNLAGLQTTVGLRGILIDGDAYTKEYREQALQATFGILKDDFLRQELTEKAYQWAIQQTWENRAKEWLDIFALA